MNEHILKPILELQLRQSKLIKELNQIDLQIRFLRDLLEADTPEGVH